MPPKKARGRGKPKEYTASAETGPSGVEPNASIASSLTHTTSGRGRGRAAKSTAMLSATDESPIEEEGAVGGVEIAKLLEEKLVFAEKKPMVTTRTIAKRPGLGKEGERIELMSNHFDMQLSRTKMTCVYQYDVDIKRVKSAKQRKLNREDAHMVFWNAIRTSGPSKGVEWNEIVFDRQKIAFSMRDYGKKPVVLTTSDQIDPTSPWEVILRLSGSVNPHDYKLTVYDANLYERERQQLQVIELVLRQGILFHDDFTSMGRSFYSIQKEMDLGCGKELLRGFYCSARVVDGWKLTLNLDVTTSVFLKQQPLLNFIAENIKIDLRKPPKEIDLQALKILNKALKDVAVKCTHLVRGRKFKIDRLSEKTARNHKFILEKDGKQRPVTVLEYFREEYKMNLKYPDWPLVKQRGAQLRLFPIEVCEIARNNRVKNKQMSVMDQAKMIRASAIPPQQRQVAINEMLKQSGIQHDARLKNFGVSVSMEMTQLQGRVLEPPKLEYKGQTLTPEKGQWDIKRNRLISPASLKSWAVVNMDPWKLNGDDKINFFVDTLIDAGRNLGMPVFQRPRHIVHLSNQWPDNNIQPFVKSEFPKIAKSIPDLELLMVIMWDKNTPAYADVKQHSESLIDVVSQCLRSDLVNQTWNDAKSRKTQQTLANLVFKINVKMGGVNTQIARFDPIAKRYLNKPVLIVGADVTHPDPGDDFSPSIAAVCANIDNHPSHYVAVEQVQIRRKEIIVELREAMKKLLLAYYENTKMKPEQIIFYRDGVSEGQFAEVLDYELRAIQAACRELQAEGYKPGITFIVQKRHHTRFFKRRTNPNDKNHNIPAGTVVDTSVVHPEEFDFFLCSHIGIQGTSKPTHYHILWDDNNFSADDLQLLSYYLCYTYARCTRSVSVVSPCYYAHHIAFRARHRLQSSRAVMDSDIGSISSVESGALGNLDGNKEEDVKKMQLMIKPGVKTAGRQYWQ